MLGIAPLIQDCLVGSWEYYPIQINTSSAHSSFVFQGMFLFANSVYNENIDTIQRFVFELAFVPTNVVGIKQPLTCWVLTINRLLLGSSTPRSRIVGTMRDRARQQFVTEALNLVTHNGTLKQFIAQTKITGVFDFTYSLQTWKCPRRFRSSVDSTYHPYRYKVQGYSICPRPPPYKAHSYNGLFEVAEK